MKKVLVVMLMIGILLLPVMALAEGTEITEEVVEEATETKEEIQVLKLPYGVSIGLMPDQKLPQVWYRTLDFDISQDLNTRILRSYIGFSTGNYITDFSIGYTREFEGGGIELKKEDQGTASFSFRWNLQ